MPNTAHRLVVLSQLLTSSYHPRHLDMANHLHLGEVTWVHNSMCWQETNIQYDPSLSRVDSDRGVFSADSVGEAFCTAAAAALLDTIQSKSNNIRHTGHCYISMKSITGTYRWDNITHGCQCALNYNRVACQGYCVHTCTRLLLISPSLQLAQCAPTAFLGGCSCGHCIRHRV